MSTSPLADLEPVLEALVHAVETADDVARRAKMEAIDAMLAGLNPLERALGFAHVHHRLGHPDKAAAVLDDLLAVIGEDAVVREQIGRYLHEAGRLDDALKAYGRAVGLDPSRVDAWLDCGTILDARGEPGEAIDCYRYALLAAPESPDVWRNLGNALAAQRKFDQAAQAYATALRFAPESDTLHVLHASAWAALGDLDRANVLLPVHVAERIGLVRQVELARPRGVLRCRFYATPSQLIRMQRAAAALLAEAARVPLDTPQRSLRDGRVFVVGVGDDAFVCDPDAARPEAPHRFFDASNAVFLG